MKNLNEIKNNNKSSLIDALTLNNIKGGIGCPPPVEENRSSLLASDPPPFGVIF